MSDIPNMLSESEYQIITDGLFDEEKLDRRGNLNLDESYACHVSAVMMDIYKFRREFNRDPWIAEIMHMAKRNKINSSISRKGYGMEIFRRIMTREIIKKDSNDRYDDGKEQKY